MISLQASIRTCDVDAGEASRIESDRFLNPNNALCPAWNGFDSAGRLICQDSFVTKAPGCNSAADRVDVENSLRPQYFEYITLDAQGLQGFIQDDAISRSEVIKNIGNVSGNFGLNMGAHRETTCLNQYEKSMRSQSASDRTVRGNPYHKNGGCTCSRCHC